MTQRRGVGQLRHIGVAMAWIQQQARQGRGHGGLDYHKIEGTKNPADICTKYLTKTVIEGALKKIGIEWRSGRAKEGLEVSRGLPTYTGSANKR